MKKENVKMFWKEHKTAIFVGIAAGCGSVIGWQLSRHLLPKNTRVVDREVLKFLENADSVYGDKRSWINMSFNTEKPLALSDLGKLADSFAGVDGTKPNQTYTHFLAIGEYK